MEAFGQRQATEVGSIHAWVAHNKYRGSDDVNAMGSGITIDNRLSMVDKVLAFPMHLVFSHDSPVGLLGTLLFQKRCSAGLIAVAVADVSDNYSLISSERVVVLLRWHNYTCVL